MPFDPAEARAGALATAHYLLEYAVPVIALDGGGDVYAAAVAKLDAQHVA